jgi:hypothetical protein
MSTVEVSPRLRLAQAMRQLTMFAAVAFLALAPFLCLRYCEVRHALLRRDVVNVPISEDEVQQLTSVIEHQMQPHRDVSFEAKNQPIELLPRLAKPSNTLCCLMRAL